MATRRTQRQPRRGRRPRRPRGGDRQSPAAGDASSAPSFRITSRRTPRRLPYPQAQEDQLAAAMYRLITGAWKKVIPDIVSAYESALGVRTDADDDDTPGREAPPPPPEAMMRTVGGLTVVLGRLVEAEVDRTPAIQQSLLDTAQLAERANGEVFAEVLGLNPFEDDDAWLEPLIDAHGKTCAELIRHTGESSAERIKETVREAWEKGRQGPQLADQLQEQMGISARRAELIARDQVGSLNSFYTEAKQRAAGINEYDWMTSGDGRVRESHQERHEVRFSWDEPPDEDPIDGHPGRPIQCRCTARSVIPDIEELTPASADERAETIDSMRARIFEAAGMDPGEHPYEMRR